MDFFGWIWMDEWRYVCVRGWCNVQVAMRRRDAHATPAEPVQPQSVLRLHLHLLLPLHSSAALGVSRRWCISTRQIACSCAPLDPALVPRE